MAKLKTYDFSGSYSNLDSIAYINKPNLLVRESTSDPGAINLHKLMKASDAPEIKEAMLNKFEQQIKRNNWESVLTSNLPKGTVLLPAVRAMHHKC
jgi:hypothetical protein